MLFLKVENLSAHVQILMLMTIIEMDEWYKCFKTIMNFLCFSRLPNDIADDMSLGLTISDVDYLNNHNETDFNIPDGNGDVFLPGDIVQFTSDSNAQEGQLLNQLRATDNERD